MKALPEGPSGQVITQSLSLRDIAVGLFRRKWLIILTFLTSLVATGICAWYTADKYESRMKFLIKNMRADAPVTTTNNQSADTNEISESQITSEMELLKSRDLLKDVVKMTNLARFEAKGREATDVDVEKAVYRLEKDLVLSPVKKASIIEVSYSSTSPETAALVLNKLSELYLEKHLKL